MKYDSSVQLSHLASASRPGTIIAEVKRIFSLNYPVARFRPIRKNYILVKKLFIGSYPGYKSCNTEYHNLSHTMDALLATTRLLDGYNLTNEPIPVALASNLLNAALLHDTGYIQEKDDHEGTGAKYTTTHVERSIRFLQQNHASFDIEAGDMPIITNFIRCTGLSVRLETIPFSTNDELLCGCILGTADLLGQMSDRAYLEKLLFLYNEFKEAKIPGFDTEFDLIRKTVDFYEITRKRLAEAYDDVYTCARHHFKHRFKIDHNLYMEAIDRHISYLRHIIHDDSTNFRHKLKRGKWVHTLPIQKKTS